MPLRISRRQVLTGAALAAAAGGYGRGVSALAGIAVGPRPRLTGGDALVVIFLRGGADGLNIVIPHGETDYYRMRPTLGIPGPSDRSVSAKGRCLDLDGFFGLHPALAALLPLYHEGSFAPVHAIGSGDHTRSHFEAMATMERGIAHDTGASSGWLARHLTSTAGDADSPLRAVAISETMPESLRGATNVASLLNLSDYQLSVPSISRPVIGKTSTSPRTEEMSATLRQLYASAGGPKAEPTMSALSGAGRETLEALDAVKRLDPKNYHAENGAVYPTTELGSGLKQAACLVKGDVGLEVACLDMGGWDTHVAQGRETGLQASRLSELGNALAAFARDLGPHLGHVTTVAMTEFGRRAAENSALGTDHGRASCMFLLGGGIGGGKVYTRWPGLALNRLEDGIDLRVTTDYRDVLAELLVRRLKNTKMSEVFPEYTPVYHNITRA